MSRLVAATIFSVVVPCAAACSSSTTPVSPTPCGVIGADVTCHTMVFGGVTRAYLLHVPANFHANTSALVVALHGSNGSGLRLMNTSGLNATADKAGFAVAYPVNVWLVAVGLKHGMGTQRALGKGGHSFDLEQVWQRMIRRGRAAHGRRREHPAAAGHSH